MTYQECTEFFGSMTAGDMFTVEVDEFSFKYTYGGMLEDHGFRTAGGGWALYGGREGDQPSQRAKVRRWKQKSWRWLTLDNITQMRKGW